MHKHLFWAAVLASVLVLPLGAADWFTHNGDNQRSGWQKDETALTKDTLKNIKLLWKVKIDNQSRSVYSIIGSPLVVQRLITDRGFKEIVYVAGSSDNLYAIDADLGRMLWKRHFDYAAELPQTQNASFLCPGGLTAGPVLTPTPARGGAPAVAAAPGAGRGAPAVPAAAPAPAPAAPAPVAPGTQGPQGPQGAAPAAARGGGGAFGVRSMYLVSSDGMLHQVNMANGEDVIPAMAFMPPNGKPYSLSINNNVLYTITGQGCGGNPNSVYSIDLADPAKTVRFWRSGSGGLWGTAGPAIGEDGTIFAETGDGTYDVATNRYANSIVALTAKELKLKDWYTPTNWEWILKRDLDMNVTPVVFNYKGRQLLVGSGKEGRMFLLDTSSTGSMGGADHQTPLFRSELIANEEVDFAGLGVWGNLASWQEPDGTRWVLAPVGGPPHPNFKFPTTNGDASHGSIAAFKVEDTNGKTVLTPAWISRDMITPAPPVVANGIVYALSTGEFVRQANERQGGLFQADQRAARSSPAVLYALDAKTGKELWSSGNQIATFGHNVGIAIANGRIYFGTYDNTVYAFGLPMEH